MWHLLFTLKSWKLQFSGLRCCRWSFRARRRREKEREMEAWHPQNGFVRAAYQFVSIAQGHCLPLASWAREIMSLQRQRCPPVCPLSSALLWPHLLRLLLLPLPFHLLRLRLRRVFCRRTVVSSFRFNKRRFRLPVWRRHRIYARLLSGGVRRQGYPRPPCVTRNCRARFVCCVFAFIANIIFDFARNLISFFGLQFISGNFHVVRYTQKKQQQQLRHRCHWHCPWVMYYKSG